MPEAPTIEAPSSPTTAAGLPVVPDTPPAVSPLMEAAAQDGFAPEALAKLEAQKAKEATTPKVEEAKKEEAATENPAEGIVELGDKKPWEVLDEPEAKKKVESKAEDTDLIPPKGLDEKGSARWKELKMAEKELPGIKAELEKLRSEKGHSEETRKEIESLRKEKEEIEQLVAERRLEQKPEFLNEVIRPIQTAEKEITKLIEIGGLNNDTISKAISIPDKIERVEAIAKALESSETPLRAMQETALYNAIENLHSAWQKEAEFRGKAREIELAATAKETSQREATEKAKNEEWTKAKESMFNTLSAKLPDLLKNPDIAKQVQERAVRATDPIDEAYNAHAAVLLPHLVKENHSLKAELKAQKALNGNIRAAAPSTDGSPAKTPTKSNEFEGMSVLDVAKMDGYG